LQGFRDGTDQPAHHGGVLATRHTGSSDLCYLHGPQRGVNLGTSHDGLTRHDVVANDEKHNEENGEHGRDGHRGEPASNHGVEGETQDRAVHA